MSESRRCIGRLYRRHESSIVPPTEELLFEEDSDSGENLDGAHTRLRKEKASGSRFWRFRLFATQIKLTSDRRTARRLLSELHNDDPIIQERAYEALCKLAASKPSIHDLLLEECGMEGLMCAPVEQVGGIKIAPRMKARSETECYRYATEDTTLLRLKCTQRIGNETHIGWLAHST